MRVEGCRESAAAVVYCSEACGGRRVIRFENVGLRYGLGPEVLRDLNFGINGQSFQYLTGPSGAGKTSLLRLMLLSLRPTRGLNHMFDHDTATLSKNGRANLRRRIGIVFQDFRLLDHLKTYENVALLLRLFVELNKSGTAVVIATHDIALMDEYDARRLVLHEGRLHVYD